MTGPLDQSPKPIFVPANIDEGPVSGAVFVPIDETQGAEGRKPQQARHPAGGIPHEAPKIQSTDEKNLKAKLVEIDAVNDKAASWSWGRIIGTLLVSVIAAAAYLALAPISIPATIAVIGVAVIVSIAWLVISSRGVRRNESLEQTLKAQASDLAKEVVAAKNTLISNLNDQLTELEENRKHIERQIKDFNSLSSLGEIDPVWQEELEGISDNKEHTDRLEIEKENVESEIRHIQEEIEQSEQEIKDFQDRLSEDIINPEVVVKGSFSEAQLRAFMDAADADLKALMTQYSPATNRTSQTEK